MGVVDETFLKEIPTMKAIIPSKRNSWWTRLLGAKRYDGRTVEFHWGEVTGRWGLALELINWGDYPDHYEDCSWSLVIQLVFGKFYFRLPFLPYVLRKGQILDSYGFSWDWAGRGADIHFNWGDKTKIISMPWDYVHVRHDILCVDGWKPSPKRPWEHNEGDPVPAKNSKRYKYVCRDGTIQDDIIATYSVEEREWRWKALRWLPWPRKVSRCISVEFDKEVGEERGSWKGGTIGCGYEMRVGETPDECLYRMQRERRFSRG